MFMSNTAFFTALFLLLRLVDAKEQICRWAPGAGDGVAVAAGALGCEISDISNLNENLAGTARPEWGSTYIVPCAPTAVPPAYWISPKSKEFLLKTHGFEPFPDPDSDWLPIASTSEATPVKTPTATPPPKHGARRWLEFLRNR
ncbi:hypothetical protein FLAG1_09589 [Fusarium langsethiae]|uniref:Uncharacterized protein n=1 Tax=Fusarium langsethiae TaxID=179993 RepID=A0A0M9EQQ9_FUSLA|nr:hypothetical protein FLAG1_09589 [Fusarium langsethiae]GKU22166.1 unnamed protein product [Fusarium langsethiae]